MTVVMTSSNDPNGSSLVVVAGRVPAQDDATTTLTTTTTAPLWLDDDDTLTVLLRGERLVVPEWENDNNNNNNYRRKHGWLGRDLVHDRVSSPVRITDYFVQYGPGQDISVVHPNPLACSAATAGGAGTVLQGIVVFTAAAESHRGYCHGGSMCSILDDCIGWTAFCVTGTCRPWTGFTVQVNTTLKQPVPLHSTLLVEGRIVRVERRKVYVTAVLYDPAKGGRDDKPAIHAVGEGIVVLNKGILVVPTEEE